MGIFLNFAPPEIGIHHQEQNVTASVENKELGKGTLYITESVLCFIKNDGEGFSLDYPSISAHAVSRDLSYFPQECLLVLINGRLSLDESAEVNRESELVKCLSNLKIDEDDYFEEEPPPHHLTFVPENKIMVDVMFRALSDCQALNPEIEEMSDEGGDVGYPIFNIQNGQVEDFDEEDAGSCDLEDDQFEDAED